MFVVVVPLAHYPALIQPDGGHMDLVDLHARGLTTWEPPLSPSQAPTQEYENIGMDVEEMMNGKDEVGESDNGCDSMWTASLYSNSSIQFTDEPPSADGRAQAQEKSPAAEEPASGGDAARAEESSPAARVEEMSSRPAKEPPSGEHPAQAEEKSARPAKEPRTAEEPASGEDAARAQESSPAAQVPPSGEDPAQAEEKSARPAKEPRTA